MNKFQRGLALIAVAAGMSVSASAWANKVGSIDTSFNLIGANHTIEVEALKDPSVEGVTCHLSYAKTGGISGSLGLAEDPSRFSIACRQTGPLVISGDYKKQTKVSSFDRNIFFKDMNVLRMWDEPNKTFIYLVFSKKLIDGSSFNAISTIPLMPWGTQEVTFK